MSNEEENICIINAECGIDTASPQISQFSHNCTSVKFIIKKDLSDCSVVIITNSNGTVCAVAEGEALTKTYDDTTKETTLIWYPQSEITFQDGCVVYQIAAYRNENEYIWYSKEGRLIVNSSIDTTDMSTALVGSSPNLVMQILNLTQNTNSKVLELSDLKADKIEGKGLSTEDYTTEEKEKLASLSNYDDTELRADIEYLESRKVDKTEGKGLSAEDYTTEEKEKLASLSNYDDTELRADIEYLESRKVDKAEGKGLSAEDYTTGEKEKLASLSNYDDTELRADIEYLESRKVDKTEGKGLSTEDYTTGEKEKLEGLFNYDDTQIRADILNLESAKVDKAAGKQLSTEDFTTNEKEKLLSLSNYDDTDIKNSIADLQASLGDIETALDGIISHASILIGGDSV